MNLHLLNKVRKGLLLMMVVIGGKLQLVYLLTMIQINVVCSACLNCDSRFLLVFCYIEEYHQYYFSFHSLYISQMNSVAPQYCCVNELKSWYIISDFETLAQPHKSDQSYAYSKSCVHCITCCDGKLAVLSNHAWIHADTCIMPLAQMH